MRSQLPNFCFRSAKPLLMISFLCSIWPITVADANENTIGKYDIHTYSVKLRAAVWAAQATGEIQTRRIGSGEGIGVEIDNNLGYDSFYPTFHGEAEFRRNRHSFRLIGYNFDESETAPIAASFNLGGRQFDVGGSVRTSLKLTDINFRYGYSIFTFEESGFRLGPTLALGYMHIDFELSELQIMGVGTPAQFQFNETAPVPGIGLNAEIPWGPVLLSGQVGGIFYDSSDFSVKGLRSELSATWRLHETIGLYFGVKANYVDVEFRREEIDDVWFWGPAIGLEFRF